MSNYDIIIKKIKEVQKLINNIPEDVINEASERFNLTNLVNNSLEDIIDEVDHVKIFDKDKTIIKQDVKQETTYKDVLDTLENIWKENPSANFGMVLSVIEDNSNSCIYGLSNKDIMKLGEIANINNYQEEE